MAVSGTLQGKGVTVGAHGHVPCDGSASREEAADGPAW